MPGVREQPGQGNERFNTDFNQRGDLIGFVKESAQYEHGHCQYLQACTAFEMHFGSAVVHWHADHQGAGMPLYSPMVCS